MSKVTVNNTAYTEVLDGSGFCISDNEIKYAFGETTPTDEDSFTLNPRNQINGTTGKKLWAKSTVFASAQVTSVAG